jgi:serine/threonine-protein kinase
MCSGRITLFSAAFKFQILPPAVCLLPSYRFKLRERSEKATIFVMLSTGKRGAPQGSDGRSNDNARPSARRQSPHSANGPWRSAAERYEVLGRAGEGTLFAVYRVRDRDNGRVYALKALKNAFVKHPRLTQTLARSFENFLPFNNPYLARVLDVGLAEGTLYFVQEWLEGRPFEDRLRQAPLPQNEIWLYTRQIVEALSFLHQNGLAHGDLRPRQICLASDTQLKIADAGIGNALHESGIVPFDIQQDTALYLAPERFDGAPPSAAGDFYALGVLLYHMIAGRVPFDGTSPLIIAARHRNDAPLRPSQFNPSCPPELEELCLTLLDKQPQRRYGAAQEQLRRLGSGDAGIYQSPYTALAPPVNQPINQSVTGLPTAPPIATPIAPPVTPPIEEFTPAAPHEDEYSEEEIAAPPQRRRSRRAEAPIAEQAMDLKLARKRHRKSEFISALLALFWMLISVGLLLGMGWFAYTSWLAEIPSDVRVPKYTGLNRSQAERVLAKAGLKLRVGSEKYNPKITQDTVLDGDPPPGKIVRQGREVSVILSKGEEPIKMYDFSELSLTRARQIISRDGMRLGQVTEQFHDSVPTGYICSQYPQPGAPFRRSEPINLTVSKGPAPRDDIEPVEPLPPPPVPDVLPEDTQIEEDTDGPTTVPMVSRSIQVRVALPKGGQTEEVKIVVNDQSGEDVVYQQMHEPGDLIDETVRVRREQGATARVRIYIGGKLFKENRV